MKEKKKKEREKTKTKLHTKHFTFSVAFYCKFDVKVASAISKDKAPKRAAFAQTINPKPQIKTQKQSPLMDKRHWCDLQGWKAQTIQKAAEQLTLYISSVSAASWILPSPFLQSPAHTGELQEAETKCARPNVTFPALSQSRTGLQPQFPLHSHVRCQL